MNVSLYQAAAAMNANARWQELISANLAASGVPGYRKQDISFNSVAEGIIPTAALGGSPFLIPNAQPAVSFQQASLRPTGNNLDFGLEGKGFFEVQMPDGQMAYTRDGEFKLNAQGQLITKQGYLVQGDSGPLQFDINNPNPITVAPTGEISQGEDVKGRLSLVEFNDPKLLTVMSGGLFAANDPKLQRDNSSTTEVRQGYLEGANTSPTAEMASLITSMRLFEANQKVLQAHDERASRVISELGGPN
jgi:flagellar basal body rod protein FlgG